MQKNPTFEHVDEDVTECFIIITHEKSQNAMKSLSGRGFGEA